MVLLSLRIYRVSLLLYPPDFRKSYGGDMLWLFERQLTTAYSAAGARGIARVWWLAYRDLACVALAGQLHNQKLVAHMISVPMTTVIFGFLIRIMQDHAFAMRISHKFLFGCH